MPGSELESWWESLVQLPIQVRNSRWLETDADRKKIRPNGGLF
jgi:hypothetical protein